MIYIAFTGFVIAAVIFVAVFLHVLETNSRRAELQKLIQEYADLTRKHAPREHVRRQMVELRCRELRS